MHSFIFVPFNELSPEKQNLLRQAGKAAAHYFNPEGTHYVGAALLTKNGEIFLGASVRRRSASVNTCSERMAIDQTIFHGHYDYVVLATVGYNIDGSINEPTLPCGLCRQIIHEFYPQAKKGSILISNADFSRIIYTDINELLPGAYT